MALHWPSFFTRLGSALIFSLIMMVGLLWNEWAFLLLTALIQFLCLREYFRLIPRMFSEVLLPDWLIFFTQGWSFLGVFLFGFSGMETGFFHENIFPAFAFVPALLLLLSVLNPKNFWKGAVFAFGGWFYISLPMILFMGLRFISISIPLALVLMIWMNDTMAYLTGSFFGKTPFSKISPKKTWEGTAGGALLTIAGAAVWGYFSPYYSVFDWIMLAVFASVAGTAGDLLESKMKRLAGVKDSGTLMPGHGGALDRFDSLLITIPFAFAYAYLFMPELLLKIF